MGYEGPIVPHVTHLLIYGGPAAVGGRIPLLPVDAIQAVVQRGARPYIPHEIRVGIKPAFAYRDWWVMTAVQVPILKVRVRGSANHRAPDVIYGIALCKPPSAISLALHAHQDIPSVRPHACVVSGQTMPVFAGIAQKESSAIAD